MGEGVVFIMNDDDEDDDKFGEAMRYENAGFYRCRKCGNRFASGFTSCGEHQAIDITEIKPKEEVMDTLIHFMLLDLRIGFPYRLPPEDYLKRIMKANPVTFQETSLEDLKKELSVRMEAILKEE